MTISIKKESNFPDKLRTPARPGLTSLKTIISPAMRREIARRTMDISKEDQSTDMEKSMWEIDAEHINKRR
jgi:hypothetical protein